VTLYKYVYYSLEHVYQVSCENVERFLSYEVRLKFLDADDAKAITITQLFFFEKTDERINDKKLYSPRYDTYNNIYFPYVTSLNEPMRCLYM